MYFLAPIEALGKAGHLRSLQENDEEIDPVRTPDKMTWLNTLRPKHGGSQLQNT